METLKDIRTSKGLTLEEAAEKLGVSINTLMRWENARDLSQIKVESAIRIIELYDVDLNFFVEKYHTLK